MCDTWQGLHSRGCGTYREALLSLERESEAIGEPLGTADRSG